MATNRNAAAGDRGVRNVDQLADSTNAPNSPPADAFQYFDEAVGAVVTRFQPGKAALGADDLRSWSKRPVDGPAPMIGGNGGLRRNGVPGAADVTVDGVQTFTSWKLDILDGMMSDPRVSDGDFRIAFRVMQACNSETYVAIISDLTLCDEVPCCADRFRANDARKRLEKLGWWTVERGHGGKASQYLFSPANINDVLDQRMLDKEARDKVRLERKSRDRRRKINRTRGRGEFHHTNTAGGRGSGHHGDVVVATTGTPSLSPSKNLSLRENYAGRIRQKGA